MSRLRFLALSLPLFAFGCSPEAPKNVEVVVSKTAGPDPARTVTTDSPKRETPIYAFVEPYLLPVAPERMILPPPAMGGRIAPNMPLVPAAPTETLPVTSEPMTPVPAKPNPAAPVTKPAPAKSVAPAMVRLLDEERGRTVDLLRRHLATATARVAQTTAEAKKTADLVRAGALAQFKSTQADAAVRDAQNEQTEIQKSLDEALQRQRETRTDVDTALRSTAQISLPLSLIQLDKPLPAYRPVPFTYQLTLLGSESTPVVTNGTLGRKLDSGAWIVRCPDPSRLQIMVGKQTATVVAHPLPSNEPPKTRA